jgi:uncharacterized membrane protein
MLLAQATFRTLLALEPHLGGIPGAIYSEAGIIAAMDWVITATITFMTFAFGTLLVAIQVSSGVLTPRIVATALLRNNIIRGSVGLFIYAMVLALAVKLRVGSVPMFLVSFVAILGVVSAAVFLFLIDYSARMLRPVSILARIARLGLEVIEHDYPRRFEHTSVTAPAPQPLGLPERTVRHRGRSAIIIAVNQTALIEAARRADGLIEMVPHVGDFIIVGAPLFRLHGGAAALDDHLLRGQVALGPERTIEQDSTFAVRVVVDIALKALSPAINDPTTAVLSIDQLHQLLHAVGGRALSDAGLRDSDGHVRLILHTPEWEDFVQLAFSEIRQYGLGNFQVARRLRAMIEHLLRDLPEARRAALRLELDLLDRTLQALYRFPEDLALARIPDPQGLGSASGP